MVTFTKMFFYFMTTPNYLWHWLVELGCGGSQWSGLHGQCHSPSTGRVWSSNQDSLPSTYWCASCGHSKHKGELWGLPVQQCHEHCPGWCSDEMNIFQHKYYTLITALLCLLCLMLWELYFSSLKMPDSCCKCVSDICDQFLHSEIFYVEFLRAT